MATCFKIIYGLFFALLCFYFKGSDTKCSSRNHFGPNCYFECHCMNNEQCNSSTGNCPSGCDFAWVGPGCQRENIVPVGHSDEQLMLARHQSNIETKQFAIMAVDKSLSTCSYTIYANQSRVTPWWRLWLKEKYKIRNVSIVTRREYLHYFKKFEVTVKNNTNKHSNDHSGQELCYKHDNTAPRTTTFDIRCTKAIYGNQLRIQLATNGTQLVLCDVRIWGECADWNFGESCTEKCSTHCQTVCDKDDGTCSSCKPGWTESRCNNGSLDYD
ncbi:uncharacterized protein LOC128557186 [Mercenaria mercenaria]|uniref:uncharacterized protein LOC128557186 n=1 Tax=Mercenaria mercenaria TaxID=6596 RepID=UPI00234F8EF0|nr:uncharacterized protein LOC128557186 [Mercenaria mercenaria]